MASPAQVANDMAVRAGFWHRRDEDTHRACAQAAAAIRSMVAGQDVDGRTVSGLCARLVNLTRRYQRTNPDLADALERARVTLAGLKWGAPE